MIVLSRYTVEPLLEARRRGAGSALCSPDLSLTTVEAALDSEAVTLPGGETVPWSEMEAIAESNTACFQVEQGRAEKIQAYSHRYGRFYSLYPTRRAPTMLLSGIPMHRIKDVDPEEDTQRKVRAAAPVHGEVLDICTGLGYTAIAAAETAAKVTTIELDETVLEIARRNPWSLELFANPRIQQMVGDAFRIVPDLPAAAYDRIFHDPPTMRLAGELYSGEMYRHLFRLLKRGGRLFHYIGDLESPLGRSVSRGATRRLLEAGFTKVTRRPEAFGLLAYR